MKIKQCNIVDINRNIPDNKKASDKTEPSFKGVGGDLLLNIASGFMQPIQQGGFLFSFLIQDGLGMTAPRVYAGFKRDKDVTGHYNLQEGKEVLLRESMSGPTLVGMAPIMLALAAIFGKSTSVNTKLIKRLGHSFKEFVADSGFDKSLLNDKTKLKNEYMRSEIRKILSNTLGKENVEDESINYIMQQLVNYQNIPTNVPKEGLRWKSKYKNQCLDNITEHINNITYSKSSKLDMLENVKIGTDTDILTVPGKEAFEALMKYSDDAITRNKNIQYLNATEAENIMNTAIAKRFITTISTIFATLGALSVIPKIYAKNDISPGARTALQMNEQKENNKTDKDTVSFKGKGGNSSSILSKLGAFLSKTFGDKFATHMEYDGHNFTSVLMAVLSAFGLLLPRGLRAYRRAQTDDTGKKDLTEIWEILIRDLSSALSVVFAVPMLTRTFVTTYEDKVGFVLMHKDRSKHGMKKVLDLFNPMSKSHVMTDKELTSLYGGINSKEKMLNFCKYIDENNGDLQKIFNKSDAAGSVFNEETMNLSSLNKLSKKEKNAKLIKFFEEFSKDNKTKADEAITKLMHGVEKLPKGNKILTFAKGMNAVPAFISTIFISPFILGWLIPSLTYANTRRIHRKHPITEKHTANNSEKVA